METRREREFRVEGRFRVKAVRSECASGFTLLPGGTQRGTEKGRPSVPLQERFSLNNMGDHHGL